MEGTSKALHSTAHRRGTVGYRAPELLADYATFNNKVDIFALGCILFELASGKKAFKDDFNVLDYAQSRSEVLIPSNEDPGVEQLVRSTLAINSFARPSASCLRTRFARNLWQALGNAYHGQQEYSLSVQAYKLALDIDSKDPITLKHLGDSYEARNEFCHAIEAYRSAIDAGYSNPSILAGLGHCLYEIDYYDEAIMVYKQALKKTPSDLSLLISLSDVYLSMWDYDNAVKMFKKMVKQKSADAVVFEKLGAAYVAQGEYVRAIKVYEAGLKEFWSQSLVRSLREARNKLATAIPQAKRSESGIAALVRRRLKEHGTEGPLKAPISRGITSQRLEPLGSAIARVQRSYIPSRISFNH